MKLHKFWFFLVLVLAYSGGGLYAAPSAVPPGSNEILTAFEKRVGSIETQLTEHWKAHEELSEALVRHLKTHDEAVAWQEHHEIQHETLLKMQGDQVSLLTDLQKKSTSFETSLLKMERSLLKAEADAKTWKALAIVGVALGVAGAGMGGFALLTN